MNGLKMQNNDITFEDECSKLVVFAINMEHQTERRKHVLSECSKVGLNPIFIKAEDGKKLTCSDIKKHTNQEKAIQTIGRELSKSEIGCALSHKKIYNKIVDESIECALIIEDDIMLKDDFVKIIDSIKHIKFYWELILLGHYSFHNYNKVPSPTSFWGRKQIKKSICFARLCNYGYGAHGYLVNTVGCKKLLNATDKLYMPIDHYTSSQKFIDVYALEPVAIDICDLESSIEGDRKESTLNKINGFKNCLRNNGLIYYIIKRTVTLLRKLFIQI